MKARGFWEAVIRYFEKETGSTRGYDSIVSKWKNRVRPRIGAFCVIIRNIEANHESGTNDLDGKKDEQQQSYIELKNRELSIREAEAQEIAQLKREKLGIQRRTLELAEREKRDRCILFYNSKINSSLPPIQQQKLLEMKMEIKE
ncbi:hypothetical protein Tco_0328747 [Tanacetum coccineum]